MSTYVEDIEFVIQEVARFARMKPDELRKLHFTELLSNLPHPSGGGQMFCGSAAYKRLRDLASLAVSRSRYAGRIDPGTVFSELKHLIVDRFYCDKRTLDTKQADRVVSSAIRAVAKNLTDLTHFIPCHLGHEENPESFSIGPVHFQLRGNVFGRLEPALRRHVSRGPTRPNSEKPEDYRKYSRQLLTDAREYYETFGWIAEVTIHDCDRPMSRLRAGRIVQNALDCLHLLIGAAYSNHMRAGGLSFNTDRRGRIEIDGDDSINLSLSTDWLGHNLGEGWWDYVSGQDGGKLVERMGIAIEAGNDISQPAPLARRFLDGIAWYGEAVRDEFPASRLIKYVLAIERIVMMKDEKEITQVFASRGSALIHDPGNDDFENTRKRFLEVYDMRSRLAHGLQIPLDKEIAFLLHEAEYLSRMVLVRALGFFKREGLELRKLKDKKLEKNYASLIEWAESTSHSN